MKNIFTCISLLLFTAALTAEPFMMLGGGANFSYTTGSDTVGQSSSFKPGFNFSLGFEQSFSDYFSLLTGVSFETRGEKENSTTVLASDTLGPIATQTTDTKIDLLYLQIPVLAQLNIPVGSVVRFNFFAGPEMGIFLFGEAKNTREVYLHRTNIFQYPKPDTVNISKEINPIDFGINAGIGFELIFDNWGIFLRPGYYLGLLNYLDKKKAEEKGINPESKHQNIYIKLGMKFNIRDDH